MSFQGKGFKICDKIMFPEEEEKKKEEEKKVLYLCPAGESWEVLL